MLFRNAITVYCEIHMKGINNICGQNIKAGGTLRIVIIKLYWVNLDRNSSIKIF